MAAHGCVLVGEHTSEMVGSTRNNDEFDYDDEFDDYDKFDCAYYDDGCAAHGDNNNIYHDDIHDDIHDNIHDDDNDNVA